MFTPFCGRSNTLIVTGSKPPNDVVAVKVATPFVALPSAISESLTVILPRTSAEEVSLLLHML